jgi:hypothetical protein
VWFASDSDFNRLFVIVSAGFACFHNYVEFECVGERVEIHWERGNQHRRSLQLRPRSICPPKILMFHTMIFSISSLWGKTQCRRLPWPLSRKFLICSFTTAQAG